MKKYELIAAAEKIIGRKIPGLHRLTVAEAQDLYDAMTAFQKVTEGRIEAAIQRTRADMAQKML